MEEYQKLLDKLIKLNDQAIAISLKNRQKDMFGFDIYKDDINMQKLLNGVQWQINNYGKDSK